MNTAYKPWCEWDIGLDHEVFTSEVTLIAAQKKALEDQDIEESWEELSEAGLIGHDKIDLTGPDMFDKLRQANRARQAVWPGENKADTLFRAVEFGGEAGELLDAVKKLHRFRAGIAGNVGKEEPALVKALREEIGYVLISLDILADDLGVELRDCVPMKFNKTSAKVGVPCFMNDDWDWADGPEHGLPLD